MGATCSRQLQKARAGHCTTLIFLTLDFEEKLSLREFLTGSLDILGIATEASSTLAERRSEDALCLDARNWTEEQQAEACSLQRDMGLLTNLTKFSGVVRDYPLVPERT